MTLPPKTHPIVSKVTRYLTYAGTMATIMVSGYHQLYTEPRGLDKET
jgi:hypothetical protein